MNASKPFCLGMGTKAFRQSSSSAILASNTSAMAEVSEEEWERSIMSPIPDQTSAWSDE